MMATCYILLDGRKFQGNEPPRFHLDKTIGTKKSFNLYDERDGQSGVSSSATFLDGFTIQDNIVFN